MAYRIGDKVQCPADRGDPAYTGTIVYIGEKKYTDLNGREYQKLTIQHPRGSKHIWPSNRLKF